MDTSLKNSDRKSSPYASKTIFDAPTAFPPKNSSLEQGIHIEHLKNQYEHLLVLYEYHIQQMNRARNRQLCEQHRGLADTISKAIAQYEALLINSGAQLE